MSMASREWNCVGSCLKNTTGGGSMGFRRAGGRRAQKTPKQRSSLSPTMYRTGAASKRMIQTTSVIVGSRQSVRDWKTREISLEMMNKKPRPSEKTSKPARLEPRRMGGDGKSFGCKSAISFHLVRIAQAKSYRQSREVRTCSCSAPLAIESRMFWIIRPNSFCRRRKHHGRTKREFPN